MRITNKLGLPEAVYNVLAKDNYVKGDSNYSVTSLLKSPRQLQLERRFTDDLVEDASDRVWSLLGQAAHTVLEQHAPTDSMSEERLYINISDRRLGGQVDNYHDGIVTDYKVTSAYSIIYASKLADWEFQLNTYAKIFRENNYPVKGLQIVAILRDWSKMKALSQKDYPQSPIQVIPITLLPDDVITSMIDIRIRLHKAAEDVPTEELPPCNAHDMWEDPTKYAVMKEGRKSAVRVYSTWEDATERIQEEGAKHYLEVRRGDRRKCKDYCSCSEICSQYQEYLNDRV